MEYFSKGLNSQFNISSIFDSTSWCWPSEVVEYKTHNPQIKGSNPAFGLGRKLVNGKKCTSWCPSLSHKQALKNVL